MKSNLNVFSIRDQAFMLFVNIIQVKLIKV